MTRRAFIQRVRRQIYNGEPADDATITIGLVNNYLNDAIAVAAKANYKDNITIDGIGYINNSFYTRFSSIAITSDGNFTWRITLPEIPIGIGQNHGISTLQLLDDQNNITRPLIPLSENQRTYFQGMQPIPNKVLCYYEGTYAYILTTLILTSYTARVTMVSGGLSSDLGSTLNVPPDFFPIMMEYLQKQLLLEKTQPLDNTNDGEDFTVTT
jgi:hypothetical protein